MTYYQPQPPPRPTPKWARKRFVLPALGLTFLLGIGSAGADETPNTTKSVADTKPAPVPTTTVTATATATETAEPEPAPTVTETVT
ncbi:hypothetical protein [Streptomyces seoulensis]|uniref:hypothetical protein n=1 Tax=Streptomyces seoulensis TaxID=73044 RepID=UPI003C2E1D46